MPRKRTTNLCRKCGRAKTCAASKDEPQRECQHFKTMAQRRARSTIPIGKKCQLCGSTEGLLRHHKDYARPYSVTTLCSKCHRLVHESNEPS